LGNRKDILRVNSLIQLSPGRSGLVVTCPTAV